MIVHASSVIPKHLAWIIVLAVTMLGTSLRAGDITGIVAFGDSLSDVGNYVPRGRISRRPLRTTRGTTPTDRSGWSTWQASSGVAAPTAEPGGGNG